MSNQQLVHEQIIVGIVHPRGSGGLKLQGDDTWAFGFTLHTWRDNSSNQLHQDGLYVKQDVSHQVLQANMSRINAYNVVQVKIKFDTATRATLLEILDDNVKTDSKMNEIVQQLQIPVTINHEIFGEFTLDKSVNWYAGKISWMSEEVDVQVSDDEIVREHQFAFIKQLWDKQKHWDDFIKSGIAVEKLELYNDTWRDYDDPILSPDEFKQDIKLESMSIDENGDYNLTFNDGDNYLFGGHWIIVEGNIATGIRDVYLAG